MTHKDDATLQTSAAEFILEGLWAHKRISRSEERGYFAEARQDERSSRSAGTSGAAGAAPPVKLMGDRGVGKSNEY